MSDSNFVIQNNKELSEVLLGASSVWKMVQHKVDADLDGDWITIECLLRHAPSGRYFVHVGRLERKLHSGLMEPVYIHFPLRLDDFEVELAEYPKSVYGYKYKEV